MYMMFRRISSKNLTVVSQTCYIIFKLLITAGTCYLYPNILNISLKFSLFMRSAEVNYQNPI